MSLMGKTNKALQIDVQHRAPAMHVADSMIANRALCKQ